MKEKERVLKAFANKRRLEIIKHLKEKKKVAVGSIAGHIKLSYPATSRHLSVLLAADIVEKDQHSLVCFYSLSKSMSSVSSSIILLL